MDFKMATRSTRTTKTIATDEGRMIAPELHTKDTDTKYLGNEPLFVKQPDADLRASTLTRSFNWYTHFFDRKVAKEQLALYAEYTERPELGKQIRKVDDKEVMSTFGWIARLHMRGLNLTEAEKAKLDAELTRLTQTMKKQVPVEIAPEEKPASNRPNVQEIMRERARVAAGDLEGILDEFIISGAKTASINVNTVGTLTEHNVLPQHISLLSEVWRKKLTEFQEILEGTDPQLTEAYAHYTKHQIKAVVKFCESVLAGLDSYINVKKAAKRPRKRKPVSAEKQVSKIKFLKTFDELKLVSVHPSKLIGATEAYCYDTSKRKLWYLVADSHVGSLGVKGSTIQGFDTTKSGMKTVRKPQEVLKKLLTVGKPASRKIFSEINAVHACPNGRSNENLIFLKVY
jgi:hypothetical protein